MKIKLTSNYKFLQVTEYEKYEIDQLRFSLRRQIPNARFHPLVKKRLWDGYFDFIDKTNLIPIGLWNEVATICSSNGIKCEFEDLDKIIDYSFNKEEFEEWVNNFFSDHPKIKPRDYQITAAAEIIKWRLSTSEIATSSGKTLIIFMVLAYLIDKKIIDKAMMVVPNVGLVMQAYEDFDFYNNDKIPMRTKQLHADSRIQNLVGIDIVIGTFQSFVKKKSEFFDGINVICIDEAHTTDTRSVKTVIERCKDSIWRFGLSGTLKTDGSASDFTTQAYLGPIVNKISPKFLLDRKYAANIKINILLLDYLTQHEKQQLFDLRQRRDEVEGTKQLNIEKQVIIHNRKRFLKVCELLNKTKHNTLALFSNVKDEYGKKIYEYMKQNTDKEVFYVDGGTDNDKREFFKKEMEEGDNRILIASFGCFSTGISINNLHNIFFLESYKSEIIVKQSIGRGMRMKEGKEFVSIFDLADDFSINGSQNYILKHLKDRMAIYKKEGFDYKVYPLKF